jgi:hypothetical protein
MIADSNADNMIPITIHAIFIILRIRGQRVIVY